MGKVVTFYSYKGGVGRTMALANIAVFLAQWKYKVLVIDWDFEAPGLEYFFKEYISDFKNLQNNEGLIEILLELSNKRNNILELLKNRFFKINIKHTKCSIHMLTAGSNNSEYFSKIKKWDIRRFYEKEDGILLFELLREQWIKEYDFILIDSRTGVTDISSICTIQFPDILVLLFAPNEQSFLGILDIADKITKEHTRLTVPRYRPFIIPIPSRFDITEEFKISQAWLNRFAKELPRLYANWLNKDIDVKKLLEITKLPYIPYFSYGEKLAVIEQGTNEPTGLGYAYKNIATLIASNLKFPEQLLTNRENTLQLENELKFIRSRVFISYTQDSEEHAKRVLSFTNLLIKDGIDCILDQYIPYPSEGWSRWMEKNIEEAEYVLMICTQTYYGHVMGFESIETGLGVKWEGNLIYNKIYKNDSAYTKFIPVLFTSDDKKYIPSPLEETTFYLVTDKKAYIALYRRLTHQPEIIKPELGEIKTLGTEQTINFFSPVKEDSQHVKIDTTKLPVTSPVLYGREKELVRLKAAWENPNTSIISFIAFGGVGKSALVNAWLNNMEQNNYIGATYVFGWSFYSQGVTEQTQASADEFFNNCLTWLGNTGKPPASQFEKGKLLSEILSEKKCLLILDGLEPLQYPPGPMCGKLKDQAMQALLKGLARSFAGLCVITSRCVVEDIQTTEGKTTFTYDLENLDEEAGKNLLKSYNIKGPDRELEQASKEFRGHALALHLLGSYLKTVHEGDIRKRDKIPALSKDEKYGGHAGKVMKSYEIWFKKANKPELDILYLLGLFDRPAATEAIEFLKKKPSIPVLTDKLVDMSYDIWQRTISHLRGLRFISRSESAVLDCHPLVREYFGEKLMQNHPEAWKQGHLRLYGYYKNLPEKYLPDTLKEMEPLFAAVRHGCLAGKHQEVLDEVFYKRIRRKNEAYIINKLGAFGADLTSLSYFFDTLWHKPATGLTEQFKAVVLAWAGFSLRAVGRLGEALEPMKVGMELLISNQDWKSAANYISNISELLVILGNLKQALVYGKQSVEYADKSGHDFEMESDRTIFANALFQAGEIGQAEEIFAQAEAIQKKSQPIYPYLYSLMGFRYCDLLLSQGKYNEVIKRAKTTLEWAKENIFSLLAIALDDLSIGKALLLEAMQNLKPDVSQAEQFLHHAVDGFRKAGRQDYLPPGLIARAAMYRYKQSFALSWADLDEAREIAYYGSMKLHLTDYYLEACRVMKEMIELGEEAGKDCFILAEGERVQLSRQGMKEKFMEFLDKAEILIAETGYHRRDEELAELKKWAGQIER